MSRIIEVIDYDPDWSKLFDEEKNLLEQTLGSVVVKVHHIGSTSVPNLAAKPIIDILLEVRNHDAFDALNSKMESIGYECKGEFGIPRRRYCQKGGDARTHQIHAFQSGDTEIIRHLAFRDYLIANLDIANEYADLKKSVAVTCDNDIEKYCDGKDTFVKKHEAIALEQLQR